MYTLSNANCTMYIVPYLQIQYNIIASRYTVNCCSLHNNENTVAIYNRVGKDKQP